MYIFFFSKNPNVTFSKPILPLSENKPSSTNTSPSDDEIQADEQDVIVQNAI